MAAVAAVAGVGMMVCCSSSVAAFMMSGDDDDDKKKTPLGPTGPSAPDETFTIPTDAVSTAECYGARYWDLRAAFGGDNGALSAHSLNSLPGGSESRDLTCNLSDEEAQCYLDRYPAAQAYAGTNLKLARKHYYEVGMGENKDFTCPPGVTELKCYGERYPELQTAFGTDYDTPGFGTTYQLGLHWSATGKGEERNFSCP
jgi:hypothetical protein